MAVYYKPQSPIQSGEDFIYPITTADQVKVDKDTRLNAVGVYLKNIDNSTDTTVYGNNATTLGGVAAEDYALKTDTAPDSSKLGGVAASDYALKTDTAPDSSKLGGKAPEYYLQPRNLLDNSDFTNPVNQRGNGSYSGDFIYTIDRWKSGEGTPNINIQDDGVKINSGSGTFPPYMFQRLEKLQAGTYTFAARFHNNTGIAAISNKVTDEGTINVPSSNNENGTLILSFTITSDLSSDNAYFRLQGGTNETSVTWDWAALYEGSYTAETLPPYVPKGYAAELAECQRYYLQVQDFWSMGIILTGTGYICLNIPTNIKMRITPNVIISGAKAYHPTYNWFDLTYTTIEWYPPFYRIKFAWPDSIQSSLSDLVLINGVSGLSADL